ncbi:hypothetical protein BASA50_007715 [Batrachochytrium salamandrivorans]|uniref:C-CAP/cofactor C-like domain-containing protein n=1 Tax=Batrachochytrium salamandrivorans TaxID=1357716 RepID=A0ABQ8F9A5_9FUNG|nr:hypothetical protein BASA60_005455 [Batrachochytrium salamandrivorans]KAH6592988.1 hypothetical protein BASA50_007715 [Batrachochytrium salamandrivorans]KAH6593535.1 hypothetical protein BASA61_004272 [Batrachochytrium salamandrivorans]KAH9248088.1 hypothetical protein BASA81_014285 [Batrachochytrium salamandrivorans]
MEHQTATKSGNVQLAAQDFWVQFQQLKQDIQERLLLCTPDKPETLAQAKAGIVSLSKRVSDATLFLPLYDQRQCALQLKELNDQVAKLQGTRARFSFKSSRTKSIAASEDTLVSQVPEASANPTSLDESHKLPTPKASAAENVKAIQAEVPLHAQAYSGISSKSVIAAHPLEPQPEQDLYIYDIQNAILDLRCISTGAVHMKNITGSLILLGPIRGSILIENCVGSRIAAVCRQCRVHETHHTRLHLHVSSHPIIEDCSDIGFSSFEPSLLRNFDEVLKNLGLDAGRNEFDKVEDFNWLRQQASPNWKLLDDVDCINLWNDLPKEDLDEDSTKLVLKKFISVN